MAAPVGGALAGDAQFQLALLDHKRKQRVITGIFIVVSIAATYIPLMAVATMVDDVAGEDTSVSVNVALTISIAISVALTGVSGALLYKMREQRQELVRLREQIRDLEREVPAMQQRSGGT